MFSFGINTKPRGISAWLPEISQIRGLKNYLHPYKVDEGLSEEITREFSLGFFSSTPSLSLVCEMVRREIEEHYEI